MSDTVQIPKAQPLVCSVCGEHDPGPAWICLKKMAGLALQGEPCSYSIEGTARFKKEMQLRLARSPLTSPIVREGS